MSDPNQCSARHPEQGDECHRLVSEHDEHHNVATGRRWRTTDDFAIAERQMRDALERIARQHHTEHCIKRQAWGDGACECAGKAQPFGAPQELLARADERERIAADLAAGAQQIRGRIARGESKLPTHDEAMASALDAAANRVRALGPAAREHTPEELQRGHAALLERFSKEIADERARCIAAVEAVAAEWDPDPAISRTRAAVNEACDYAVEAIRALAPAPRAVEWACHGDGLCEARLSNGLVARITASERGARWSIGLAISWTERDARDDAPTLEAAKAAALAAAGVTP